MYSPYSNNRKLPKYPFASAWNKFYQPDKQWIPGNWNEGAKKMARQNQKASLGTLARLVQNPYTRSEGFVNSQKAQLQQSLQNSQEQGARKLRETASRLGTSYSGLGMDMQRKVAADNAAKLGTGINTINREAVDKNRNDLLRVLNMGLGQRNVDRRVNLAKYQADKGVASSEASRAPSMGGGKVICSELYRQGLLPEEVRDADELFGEYVRLTNPTLIKGYWYWAVPAVEIMKKSKICTWIAKKLAVSWATEIAYQLGYVKKGSKFGRVVSIVGSVICYHIGTLIEKKQEVQYVK